MCDDWKSSYASFYSWAIENGYNDNLTIERKNVDGNYEPDNCCWITKGEQAFNRRTNLFVIYKGEKMPASKIDKKFGFRRGTTAKRIHSGWSIEQIVSTPTTRHNTHIKKED